MHVIVLTYILIYRKLSIIVLLLYLHTLSSDIQGGKTTCTFPSRGTKVIGLCLDPSQATAP